MKYTDTFNAIINEGFSNEVATLAVILLSMNINKKVKMRHLAKRGVFTSELIASFKEAMWQEDESTIEEAIKVWDVLYDYDISQSFNGLGGCVKKTIRELIQKNI